MSTEANQPSALSGALNSVLDFGSRFLQTAGANRLALEEARGQARVQEMYTDLARASPNLGPNESAPAERQAVAQVKLMEKIDPRSSSFNPVWLLAVVAIGAVAWMLFRKR